MPNNELPVTVDAKPTPAIASDTPQSTTAPETDVSAESTTGLDLRGYELSERLGGGGMGDVYRAGDPALGRDLAVKVMKADLQGYAAAEQRFLREARITGSLQHPGIVPIYNLGRLSDGRLHYTMRLVRGHTFADLLKEDAGKSERLPALLTIFEKVCQSVAYAHSKHVLHRDLKPANIMVGRFGEVQVMDWGLAKLLTPGERGCVSAPSEEDRGGTRLHTEDAETPPELTRLGREMGTPAYMPPEQALGEWDAVDERADVFALGAILCEILTGRPPYRGGEVMQKAKQGDLAEALARLEDCGADAALRELCRDCLTPAREHRPRDAEQVAQRVAAYQAQVQERLRRAELERAAAVVQTRWERKRRRWMLAAAVLLLAGTAVSISLAVWATKAADAERQAKDLAQTRLGQMEKAYEVSTSIFHDLDPRAEAKGGPSLRQQLGQHLQRAAAQLDKGAIGDEVTAARLQTVIGKSLISLGNPPLAIELLSNAGRTLEGNLGSDHPDTLTSRNYLAAAYLNAGRTAEAIRLYEQTLKQLEATFGPGHRHALSCRNNLAVAYNSAGRTAEAVRLLEQTLKQLETNLGPDHPDTLSSRSALASAYRSAGRIAEAIRLSEQTLEQRVARLGPNHPDTLASRGDLAATYWSAGRTAEAIPHFEQTLKQMEATLAADHPDTLSIRTSLATAYRAAGRIDEAIRLHEQTLKQMEAKLAADHPNTLAVRNNLAEAYRSAGRIREAVRMHEQTLKQREVKLGADHSDTLASRHNLAAAYWSAGRTTEATRLLEQNLKQSEAKLGHAHPHTLISMANLGKIYSGTDRLSEAISAWETVLERGRKRSDGLPVSLAWVPGTLAEIYEQVGQFAQAESIYREALEQAQHKFGPDDLNTAAALAQLGDNLLKQKRPRDAEPLLRQCLTLRDKKQPDVWNTFNTRSALGKALLDQKKYTQAEPLLLQGYEGMKQRQDKISPAYRQLRLREALERLVRLYEVTEQKEKAAKWRKKLEEGKAVQKKSKP